MIRLMIFFVYALLVWPDVIIYTNEIYKQQAAPLLSNGMTISLGLLYVNQKAVCF